MLEFFEAQPQLEHVVVMAKNAVLKWIAASGVRPARQQSRRSGKTEHLYGGVRCAARKWRCPRQVVIKAEVVRAPGKDPKDKPRFVITNLKQSPQWIYEQVCCRRGDIENRTKSCTIWRLIAPVAAVSGRTSSGFCSRPPRTC